MLKSTQLVNRLYKANVKFNQEVPKDDSPLVDFILYWILPTILMISFLSIVVICSHNTIESHLSPIASFIETIS